MCLLLLAHRVHPQYPLLIAANRDEFYERPTVALARWEDAPEIHAGRDLRGGGTWLGAAPRGRWAAVTNVREPGRRVAGASSRGAVVRDFLIGEVAPAEYLARLATQADRYNGFNLVIGDPDGIWYVTNRGADRAPRKLGDGIHGLSNAGLDTPWPKVTAGKDRLRALISRSPAADRVDAAQEENAAANPPLAAGLFELLTDRTVAPDDALPDTGVGLAWERRLAPAFIVSRDYGTRCSTVLLGDAGGGIMVVERSYIPATDPPDLAAERRVRLPG